MEKIKAAFISIFTAISSFLGILAIPVWVMIVANIVDYITGLIAAPYRNNKVNSNQGIRGIIKKICMWVLVGIGAGLDYLLLYCGQAIGITIPLTFLIASLVAVWITCNEIISILENISDIGVKLPPFLNRLVIYIKEQVEQKVEIKTEGKDYE